jgi:hypothetical protein
MTSRSPSTVPRVSAFAELTGRAEHRRGQRRHRTCARAAARGQPGKTVGSEGAVQANRVGTVPLGRERIWPIDLCFVFIFSEYSNPCKVQKFV